MCVCVSFFFIQNSSSVFIFYKESTKLKKEYIRKETKNLLYNISLLSILSKTIVFLFLASLNIGAVLIGKITRWIIKCHTIPKISNNNRSINSKRAVQGFFLTIAFCLLFDNDQNQLLSYPSKPIVRNADYSLVNLH